MTTKERRALLAYGRWSHGVYDRISDQDFDLAQSIIHGEILLCDGKRAIFCGPVAESLAYDGANVPRARRKP